MAVSSGTDHWKWDFPDGKGIAKVFPKTKGGGTGRSGKLPRYGDRSGFSGGSFWNFVSGVWMEPLAGTDIGNLYVLSAFGNKVSSGWTEKSVRRSAEQEIWKKVGMPFL